MQLNLLFRDAATVAANSVRAKPDILSQEKKERTAHSGLVCRAGCAGCACCPPRAPLLSIVAFPQRSFSTMDVVPYSNSFGDCTQKPSVCSIN